MKLSLRARILKLFATRKQAYQLAFSSPAGQIVLKDLAKFCRASETCFHDDQRIHAAMEGRRDVWLRIQRYLSLTPEQLTGLRPENNGEEMYE